MNGDWEKPVCWLPAYLCRESGIAVKYQAERWNTGDANPFTPEIFSVESYNQDSQALLGTSGMNGLKLRDCVQTQEHCAQGRILATI